LLKQLVLTYDGAEFLKAQPFLMAPNIFNG